MSVTVQISAKIDSDIKPDFERICKRSGVSVSSAINIFVRRMVYTDGFPFDLNEKIILPNEMTIEALQESQKTISNSTSRNFSSLYEMRKAMSFENESDKEKDEGQQKSVITLSSNDGLCCFKQLH
jgi:DNA-damage-inducible protein J